MKTNTTRLPCQETNGSILDTEAQWNKLFFSKKVFVALPIAIAAAAPFALLGAATRVLPKAAIAQIGKTAAVALLGEKRPKKQ